MAQKLWEKNVQVDHEVDIFTVGKDREMDLYLAKYDVLGSMAHITMLERMCTRKWNSCLHVVWAIWARRSIAGVPVMIRSYWI